MLSDIWGNTITQDVIQHDQFLTDGIILSYKYEYKPSNLIIPTKETVNFLNPDLSVIAQCDCKTIEDKDNDCYWNELFSHNETKINHISWKGINGIKTTDGWFYFEINQ